VTRFHTIRRPLVLVAALALFGGCAAPSGSTCDPCEGIRPAPAPCPPREQPADAPYVPLPVSESPEARNERLMRLEWAQDQWWAATQKQEYEKQSSIENLLRTYVADHFDPIASDLQSGSPRHRRTMAMALGFSGRQEAVPLLTEALKDQYYEVVLHALLALYQLAKGDPSGVKTAAGYVPIYVDPEAVVPYLRHPRPEVRSNAALVLTKTLGRNPQKGLLLVVVAATEDIDPATRAHAVAALGTTSDREVFPYVVKALGDSVQLVRIRAALSIGRLGDPDGVPYLLSILENQDEKVDVKRAAAKALGEIMGTTTIDSLDACVWRDAAEKMGMGAKPK
jgi:HEAT repeat protein